MNEWINKIDVATRQIRTSIRFIFEETDPIIVHSIISAAHQILIDMSRYHQRASSIVKPDGYNRKLLNNAANFFKHADRDPSGRINIEPLPEMNSILLVDAIVMLQTISGSLPMEAKIFLAWYMVNREEDFARSGKTIDLIITENKNMRGMSLREMRQLLQFQQVLNAEEPLPSWAELHYQRRENLE